LTYFGNQRLIPNNMSLTITNLTPKQLREAASIKEQIEKLEQELSQLLGAPVQTAAKHAAAEAPVVGPKKRKLSAAGRAAIIAAAKARWAKLRGASHVAPAPRRTMSAAGRASIAAAQRARWAKLKGKVSRTVSAYKPRRKMSAAAKARLSALAKARWKKAKASGKSRL
jgi:hypothetical protein